MERHVSARPSSFDIACSDGKIQEHCLCSGSGALAGAKLAFAFVLARYPTLDLELIARENY
jgi:hypothetical protein